MRGILAWCTTIVLLALVVSTVPSFPLAGTTAAEKPKPSPTAPPDLVVGYRKICQRLPQPARDQCLVGIVEQLGEFVEERALVEVCKVVKEPLDQAICYGLATVDPSQCDGVQGDTAALERELCVGRVAEVICFRKPAGADRESCLEGIAVKHHGPFACASIDDWVKRQLCYAVASRDEVYCDRLKEYAPAFEAQCRERVRAARSGVTPGASGSVAGPAWSGTFPDTAGSSLRLALGADGKLAGRGTVPVTGNPAIKEARLTVSDSSAGSDSWSGTMKVELVGVDGKIQYDALMGLGSEEVVGWTAQRDGDGLRGTVDTYGPFVLSPAG